MEPMQKRIAIVTVLVIAAVAAFVFLQPDPGPCRKIRAACEAQGFKRGHTPSERRAFQENCFRPLLQGQAVRDVRIDEEVATACRQRQSERRGRGGRGGGRGGRRGPPQESPPESQPQDPDSEVRALGQVRQIARLFQIR